ncbi:ATP-binding protein [Sphingobium sp. AN641]|uniref:ATP-binding protein n=1 Tax=Sphingobium sp. AN641 TaxID=3133443 RepID=UPI0030BC0204
MTAPFPLKRRWLPRQWPADAASAKNMLLLVQLRWIAIAGQIATILIVHFAMGIALPLPAMLLLPGAAILVNIVTLAMLRRRPEIAPLELFIALLFDVLSLSIQFYLSGGATNPFISLYLLQVALSAILLDRASAWWMVAITAICASILTVAYRPLLLPSTMAGRLFDLHIAGAWLCFIMIAVLLIQFMTRINRNLQAREAHLAAMRQHAAEEEHIVRMGLLASGAAHELGTPLSSLSVILGDWRHMPDIAGNPALAEDLAEMQAQVLRCKAIVTGILLSAGEARGEAPEVTGIRAFIGAIAQDWRTIHSDIILGCEFGPHDYPRIVADPVIRQALANLLDNAAEAGATHIDLIVGRDSSQLNIAVRDNGQGFSDAMLTEFGKPYRSTKGKQGGGLGLFLVVNVVRKLGGDVTASNLPDGGAQVLLRLPLPTLAYEGSGHEPHHER